MPLTNGHRWNVPFRRCAALNPRGQILIWSAWIDIRKPPHATEYPRIPLLKYQNTAENIVQIRHRTADDLIPIPLVCAGIRVMAHHILLLCGAGNADTSWLLCLRLYSHTLHLFSAAYGNKALNTTVNLCLHSPHHRGWGVKFSNGTSAICLVIRENKKWSGKSQGHLCLQTGHPVNSLAPGKFEWNYRFVIFQGILVIDGWSISCEIALIWMSLDFTDDQSTLVQVMAWCRQATSHYLSQCWPGSLTPYGFTRPQRVSRY